MSRRRSSFGGEAARFPPPSDRSKSRHSAGDTNIRVEATVGLCSARSLARRQPHIKKQRRRNYLFKPPPQTDNLGSRITAELCQRCSEAFIAGSVPFQVPQP